MVEKSRAPEASFDGAFWDFRGRGEMSVDAAIFSINLKRNKESILHASSVCCTQAFTLDLWERIPKRFKLASLLVVLELHFCEYR